MSAPVSVRLDDNIRPPLAEEARRVRRERIRRQSREVGAYVAAEPQAREFYEELGTPKADGV